MCRTVVPARFTWLRFVATLLVLCLGIGAPGAAAAHAVLVSSTPEQGERLAASPKAITLTFSEAVTQVVTTLVSRKGQPVTLPARVAGDEVTVELATPLAPGAYALSWRVVSEDGHPVAASIVFAVGKNAILAGLSGAMTGGGWLQFLTLAVKCVFYASCLFGIGGTVFSVWIAQSPPGGRNTILLFAAAACGLLLVGLLGVEEGGLPLAALAGLQPWTTAAGSSLARSMALVGVALAFALAARIRPLAGKALSAVALLLLGPAFALTGHASGAGIAWLSFAAVSAHVAAVCFWTGALPGLWSVLAPERTGQGKALSRFSSAIPISIAVIVAAGTYLAFVQVGTLAGLLGTDYGKVLLTKLGLVAAALALGAWNRYALTARVERGDAAAQRQMRTVVLVETLLVVMVLCATSLWRLTPPPRALALRATFSSVHLHDPTAMATLSFKTRPDLLFDVGMSVENGTFAPLDARDVTLRLSAADGSIAPFNVPVRRLSVGQWGADHVQAPCNCQWSIRVEVLVTDFDQVTLNGTIRLLPPQ